MITPFCSICLKSGVLCQACEDRLKGQLSQFDYDVCRYLCEKFDEVNTNVEYVSSFLAGNVALLFMRGNVGSIIGHDGTGVKELAAKFGKRIKIINVGSDIKTMIVDIINPLELLGINKLFKDGRERYKIRISKKNFMRLSFDITSLEKVLSRLLNADVMIAFE